MPTFGTNEPCFFLANILNSPFLCCLLQFALAVVLAEPYPDMMGVERIVGLC
jgi:hypothetical protein